MADENYAKVSQMIRDGIIASRSTSSWATSAAATGGADDDRRPERSTRPDLDWQRFLGDAPQVDYTVSRFFQWRLYWDYAGGPATDLLVHVFTPVFCLLGLDYPARVFGGGGGFQYDREVPISAISSRTTRTGRQSS